MYKACFFFQIRDRASPGREKVERPKYLFFFSRTVRPVHAQVGAQISGVMGPVRGQVVNFCRELAMVASSQRFELGSATICWGSRAFKKYRRSPRATRRQDARPWPKRVGLVHSSRKAEAGCTGGRSGDVRKWTAAAAFFACAFYGEVPTRSPRA